MKKLPRLARSMVGALMLVALVPATSSTAASADDGPAMPRPDGVDGLRADASTPVRVHRDRDGDVDMLWSPGGRAMVAAVPGTGGRPAEAARAHLHRYGDAVNARAVSALSVYPAATGGSVVRMTQQVDGRPVVGGEVVMSLDAHDGLVSMAAKTTSASRVALATVTAARARRTAVAATSAAHQVPARNLTPVDEGQWVYDAALVGESRSTGPADVRPVWRFEVTGAGVRELVLVDATRGGVVLHADKVTGLSRTVCDRNNQAISTSVPTCSSSLAVRKETTGPTGNAEVDLAFDHVGEASAFLSDALGTDVGELVGTGTAGSRVLQTWVRWCTYGQACPMANAFWDGARLMLGDGFAAADDVVTHEMTHAVIDRTSELMYLHQSGAINESLADVMGELADQRLAEPGEDDSAWLLGEDAPGGPIRSLADPTLYGQPDRMTSPFYGAGDAEVDNGEVHQNSGVGNKAAYLISQGGVFGGQTVRGIDSGDPTRAKTAFLYGQVLTRLPSGGEYDTLARTLRATCAELAAVGTAGFTAADCDSVGAAVAATAMDQQPADPTAASPEAPEACPDGQVKTVLFRDDDANRNAWSLTPQQTSTTWPLWTSSPQSYFGLPRYAHSGAWSWFGADPDPAGYGDPVSSGLWPTNGIAVPQAGRTYLHFHHAHLLEWYPATDAAPARYPDGGTVQMYTPTDYGWGEDMSPLTWVNGPDKPVQVSASANVWRGFGGDSHGYGSSRADLTTFAGKSVRPMWKVVGSRSIAFLGWYVDDITVYNCRSAVPTAAQNVTATGTATGARLSWTPPSWSGSGITGYRITRSDGLARTVPAGARSTTYASLPAGPATTFSIVPLNGSRQAGPAVTRTVRRTTLTSFVPRTRVQKTYDVRLSVRLVRAGLKTPVAGMPVQFQVRPVHSPTWRTVWTRRTDSYGRTSLRMVIYKTSYLRAVGTGSNGFVGSTAKPVRITSYTVRR